VRLTSPSVGFNPTSPLIEEGQTTEPSVSVPNPAAAKLAAFLLLAGPGSPFLYYGEEIGMTGAKPDERIRTPMRWDASTPAAGFSTAAPWEALSGDAPGVNVTSESADPASLWSRYRDLIGLRALHPALATGTWAGITSDLPNVVAALRASPTEVAVTLTNVGAEPASPTLSLETGPLCGAPTTEAILGAPSVAAPTVTPTGGFAGWKPVATIPGRSSVVVVLGRAG